MNQQSSHYLFHLEVSAQAEITKLVYFCFLVITHVSHDRRVPEPLNPRARRAFSSLQHETC